ncbi:helix-turn-helix transcriptional regulator [bacterium SCSIO 12741]|nr:helix-turn-helix transcriptional regulator [bacterium SCSIO 12741]
MSLIGSIQNLQQGPVLGFGEGRFVRSNLNRFEKSDAASPLSLKIVRNGAEKYQVGSQAYKVQSGQVLLVNRGEALETQVHSRENTSGVCIYPPMDLIEEVYFHRKTSLDQQLEFSPKPEGSYHFTSRVFRLDLGNGLTHYLNQSIHHLEDSTPKDESWWLDFYLNLAEHMVSDQMEVESSLQRVVSVKKQTREELYRRILKARDYIHDHKFGSIDLDTLAQNSSLSKFHFLRTFKAIFGKSPYQYLLQLKIKEAQVLLDQGVSYQEAALAVGYSDGKNLRKVLVSKKCI